MTDRTPPQEREREAEAAQPVLNAKLSARASGHQVAPIVLAIGLGDEAHDRWLNWYNPAHWFWWGRGLGVFIGIIVKEREAAVAARVRAELREKVEGMRAERMIDVYDTGYEGALSAVLAALAEEATG